MFDSGVTNPGKRISFNRLARFQAEWNPVSRPESALT